MSSVDRFVEVVYARPDRQRVVRVPWRDGMTAREAVEAASLGREFPELADQLPPLGIFGRRVADDEPVGEGDRIELYRPLKSDPREARRRAAEAARGTGRSRRLTRGG